jgi:hypothetical protein
MKTLDLALTLTTLAVLPLPSLAAQSIDGQVIRNPDDTVTYAIDVDGPPLAHSVLFVSPFLSSGLPTPFGPLVLDPTFLLDLGVVPLDANGQGQLVLTTPPNLTNGIPLSFQSCLLTPTGINLVPQAMNAVQNNAAGAIPGGQGGNDWFAFSNGANGAKFEVGGNPGAIYIIYIKNAAGVVIGQQQVTVGPNGKSPVVMFPPAGIGPGSTYEVWRDVGAGQVTLRWQGSF